MSYPMPRCGTCKHFKPDIDERARNVTKWDEDGYKRIPVEGYGQCGRVPHAKREDVPLTDAATVADGSGYYAALICRQDFGCVLHESKP